MISKCPNTFEWEPFIRITTHLSQDEKTPFLVPVDPEPRISLDEVNARVQLITMYYINDIIQYHEVAIENVAKSVEKFVKKVNNLS